jgi:hypothetical protein
MDVQSLEMGKKLTWRSQWVGIRGGWVLAVVLAGVVTSGVFLSDCNWGIEAELEEVLGG